MNGLLRAKALTDNIEISAKEIKDLAEKLTFKQVKEFADDYGLSLEQAQYDLAEYILYNNKLGNDCIKKGVD